MNISNMLDPALCNGNDWVDLSVQGYVSVIDNDVPVAMVRVLTIFIDSDNNLTTTPTPNQAKVMVLGSLTVPSLYKEVIDAFKSIPYPTFLGSNKEHVPERIASYWKRFYATSPHASMPEVEDDSNVVFLYKRVLVKTPLATATLNALGEVYGGIR